MKQISLVVSITALIAVIILYILHFSAMNKTNAGNKTNAISHEHQSVVSEAQSLRIAYVKADSVIINYDLAQDLHDEFTKRQEAYNSEFSNKRQSFERDAVAFQEKLQRGGFLTEQRAMQERDRLVGIEQEIMQLDQELSGKLAELQANNNRQILDSLLGYLEELNSSKKYDYILNGSEILVGSQANNITAEVLKGLNERYAKK